MRNARSAFSLPHPNFLQVAGLGKAKSKSRGSVEVSGPFCPTELFLDRGTNKPKKFDGGITGIDVGVGHNLIRSYHIGRSRPLNA